MVREANAITRLRRRVAVYRAVFAPGNIMATALSCWRLWWCGCMGFFSAWSCWWSLLWFIPPRAESKEDSDV